MTVNRFPKAISMLVAGLAMVLTACSDSDGGGTAKISMAVTDAPVDSAQKVVVEFDGVELKPGEGKSQRFDFDAPRQIDLLALQNGLSEPLIEDREVPAGRYQWVRLHLTDDQGLDGSYLEGTDGGIYTLAVPSGSESGLKLVEGFALPVGGEASFTIDFDLRKSVTNPGGSSLADYLLKPALRLVDNAEVGSVEGRVDESLITDASCTEGNAIYAYTGSDATVEDLGSGYEPLASASVAQDADGSYRYKLAYMAPGDYTLAFTCQAADDEPETDDSIAFPTQGNATVTTGETVTLNLP